MLPVLRNTRASGTRRRKKEERKAKKRGQEGEDMYREMKRIVTGGMEVGTGRNKWKDRPPFSSVDKQRGTAIPKSVCQLSHDLVSFAPGSDLLSSLPSPRGLLF